MNKTERKAIYKEIIKEFGADILLVIAIEEMSELTKELTKTIRGHDRRSKVIVEMGDVKIMLEELEMIFDCEDEVEERIDFKLNDSETRRRITKRGEIL